jgi:type II secretory pathway component PulF
MGMFGDKYLARGRFYDALATAIDAGLPTHQALHTLAGSGEPLSADLVNRVSAGGQLSEAMSDATGDGRHEFTRFELVAVRAGEDSGNLPLMLRRLGRAFQVRGTGRDKVAYGLFYPFVLLHGVVLLPPLYRLFGDGLGAYLGVVLPILLGAYGVLAVVWWLVRGVAATDAGRGRLDALLLRLPIAGRAVRARALADYCLTFLTLYTAGVPMLETLTRAGESTDHAPLRAAGLRLAECVRSGGTLQAGLSRERAVFPQEFVQAVAVGESAGKLEATLERAEAAARHEAERAQLALVVALAVTAYAIAALAVGWVVLSFWLGVTRLPEGI